jgi:hypothetical protein
VKNCCSGAVTGAKDDMIDCLLKMDENFTKNLFMSVWIGFLSEHKNSCAIEGKIIIIIIIMGLGTISPSLA